MPLLAIVHGDRVGEEGYVGFAAAHLVDCFASVAQIADVGLLANLFCIEAEQAIEHDGVELAQVELALVLGQVGQGGCSSIGPGAEQECSRRGSRLRRLCPDCRLRAFDVARGIGGRKGFDGRRIAAAALGKAAGSNPARPWTTRCVGRMTRPSESMLTKVIMTAASGNGGMGQLVGVVLGP